jgi:HPt (histidine-containing phosphotransfer) domain-containing protein
MGDAPLDPATLDMLRQLTRPGEPDVLREVLQLFQTDIAERLAALDAALSSGDLAGVARTAHTVKGSAGNIGARPLLDACRAVEDSARQRDPDRVRLTVNALHGEVTRVASAIDALLA